MISSRRVLLCIWLSSLCLATICGTFLEAAETSEQEQPEASAAAAAATGSAGAATAQAAQQQEQQPAGGEGESRASNPAAAASGGDKEPDSSPASTTTKAPAADASSRTTKKPKSKKGAKQSKKQSKQQASNKDTAGPSCGHHIERKTLGLYEGKFPFLANFRSAVDYHFIKNQNVHYSSESSGHNHNDNKDDDNDNDDAENDSHKDDDDAPSRSAVNRLRGAGGSRRRLMHQMRSGFNRINNNNINEQSTPFGCVDDLVTLTSPILSQCDAVFLKPSVVLTTTDCFISKINVDKQCSELAFGSHIDNSKLKLQFPVDAKLEFNHTDNALTVIQIHLKEDKKHKTSSTISTTTTTTREPKSSTKKAHRKKRDDEEQEREREREAEEEREKEKEEEGEKRIKMKANEEVDDDDDMLDVRSSKGADRARKSRQRHRDGEDHPVDKFFGKLRPFLHKFIAKTDHKKHLSVKDRRKQKAKSIIKLQNDNNAMNEQLLKRCTDDDCISASVASICLPSTKSRNATNPFKSATIVYNGFIENILHMIQLQAFITKCPRHFDEKRVVCAAAQTVYWFDAQTLASPQGIPCNADHGCQPISIPDSLPEGAPLVVEVDGKWVVAGLHSNRLINRDVAYDKIFYFLRVPESLKIDDL